MKPIFQISKFLHVSSIPNDLFLQGRYDNLINSQCVHKKSKECKNHSNDHGIPHNPISSIRRQLFQSEESFSSDDFDEMSTSNNDSYDSCIVDSNHKEINVCYNWQRAPSSW